MFSCLHRHILLSGSLELPKCIKRSKLGPKLNQTFYFRCYFQNFIFSFQISSNALWPSCFIFFLLPLFREVQCGRITSEESLIAPCPWHWELPIFVILFHSLWCWVYFTLSWAYSNAGPWSLSLKTVYSNLHSLLIFAHQHIIFLKLACWFPIPIVPTNKVKHSLTPEMLRGSAVLIIALLLEDYWTLGSDDSWDVGTDRSLRNFLVQSPAQIVRGDPTGWVSWPKPNSWWAVTVGTWSLSADFHFQGLCATLFTKFLPVIELTGMWLKVVFATSTVS